MSNKILPLGGNGRDKVQKQWKTTRWKLELKEDKLPNKHVIAAATAKKCTILQEKLNNCGKQLRDTTNQLKKLEQSTVRLSNALRSETNFQAVRRKRKAWAQCTPQYKNNQKKKNQVGCSHCTGFYSN